MLLRQSVSIEVILQWIYVVKHLEWRKTKECFTKVFLLYNLIVRTELYLFNVTSLFWCTFVEWNNGATTNVVLTHILLEATQRQNVYRKRLHIFLFVKNRILRLQFDKIMWELHTYFMNTAFNFLNLYVTENAYT